MSGAWRDFFGRPSRPASVHQVQRVGRGSVSIQSGGDVSGISQFSGDRVTRMKINGVDVSYDSEVGMVYVALPAGVTLERRGGIVKSTTTVCESPLVNLDRDVDGVLVGVEIEVGHG